MPNNKPETAPRRNRLAALPVTDPRTQEGRP